MARYRVKPGCIEAVLYDGIRVGEPDGMGGARRRSCPSWLPIQLRVVSVEPTGETLREGEAVIFDGDLWLGARCNAFIARPGDWLIRFPDGRIATMSAGDFADNYETTPVYP